MVTADTKLSIARREAPSCPEASASVEARPADGAQAAAIGALALTSSRTNWGIGGLHVGAATVRARG